MVISKDNSANNRLIWIDYAKGVGIVLVVYGHIMRGLKDAGAKIDKNFYHYSDTFIYSFHMPLFFILSGYFFYGSFIKNPSKFVINKLKTLAYPFVIWSLLQTAVELLLSRYVNHKNSSDTLLWCLLVPRAQFWFLYALFFISIINFICFKVSKMYGLYISLAIWLVYFAFKPDLMAFGRTFQYLIFFNAGILISKFNHQFFKVLKSNLYLILTAAAFAVFEFLNFSYNSKNSFTSLFIIAAILGSVMIMQFSERAVAKNIFKFFVYLGKESLAIYLVHILVISGIRIILFKVLRITNPVIDILLAMVAGIAIPLIIYSFAVDRPYLSWLFKFPSKKSVSKKEVVYQIP